MAQHSLTRGPDGRFKDSDLAKILQDGTEWRAGAFQGRGTPEVLRVIEIMGIEQARGWGTCSVSSFPLTKHLFLRLTNTALLAKRIPQVPGSKA